MVVVEIPPAREEQWQVTEVSVMLGYFHDHGGVLSQTVGEQRDSPVTVAIQSRYSVNESM